jgi:hypothetical protein
MTSAIGQAMRDQAMRNPEVNDANEVNALTRMTAHQLWEHPYFRFQLKRFLDEFDDGRYAN